MNDCGNKSPRSLRSESGVFLLDREGVAQVFSASEENPMLKEYHGSCRKVINSFVVPHGVKGIGGRILNEIWVREKFELPDGLVHIGRGSSAFGPRAFLPNAPFRRLLFRRAWRSWGLMRLRTVRFKGFACRF